MGGGGGGEGGLFWGFEGVVLRLCRDRYKGLLETSVCLFRVGLP